MGSVLAGIDFSSKAIHAALIPLDPDDGSDAPPVTLRSFVMPSWRGGTTPAFRSVERCRVVRVAMRELLAGVDPLTEAHEQLLATVTISPPHPGVATFNFSQWYPIHEVVHVCVEEPFGASRKADNVMRELYGAILASIPPHIERDTITTQEWRRIIWPDGDSFADLRTDWKAAAIGMASPIAGAVLDEHQAEATLIARACRARLDKAFAA